MELESDSIDASDFVQCRTDMVLTFHKWSHPMVETGISRETMAISMRDMSNDLLEFKKLASESTGACFVERCDRISYSLHVIAQVIELVENLPLRAKVSALNMFNALADQIGRLSLHAYTDEDEFAVIMFEKAKSETYRWHHRYSDPQCEQMQRTLTEYWDYLHYFLPGCTCNNCKWEYELKNELNR